MATTEERLAAIEAKLNNLTLSDLPLAALQRKLETSWQPDPSVLFSGAMLSTGGKAPVTWGGVVNQVNGTTPHGLGRVPQAVVADCGGVHYLFVLITAATADSFSWQVSSNGGVPPAGHSDDLYWIAVG